VRLREGEDIAWRPTWLEELDLRGLELLSSVSADALEGRALELRPRFGCVSLRGIISLGGGGGGIG
jgi:hypothetical protein